MIETLASKSSRSDGAPPPLRRDDSNRRPEIPPKRRACNPLTWLNLVCLDAPIVAISWMFLFAHKFDIAIAPGGTTALFLTAWFIYLADRFVDNLSLDQPAPLSLRQRFCRQHRVAWFIALLAIGAADVFVVLAKLDSQTRIVGAVVSAAALTYLCLNQFVPVLWRWLPLKELCIGSFFAAGTIVPLAHGLTSAMTPAWILFAGLCSINCISIAVWERELDLAQHRVSIATVLPNIDRVLLPGAILLGLTSCVFGALEVAISVALLATAHIVRHKLQPDVRTALADLVLLTPIVRLLT